MPPSSRLLRQSSQMKKSSPLSVRIRREDFYNGRRAAAAASRREGELTRVAQVTIAGQ